MEALGFSLRAEAMLQTLTEDVTKSSQIEGAVLDRDQVRSSIARRLGIDVGAKAYYNILESTQEGDLDITEWLQWFLGCLGRTFDGAETILAAVLRKARFWESNAGTPLNERQRKIRNRLLDGFVGKLTSSKWAVLGKCSQDTALRDLDDLVRRGILVKNPAGGRSTSYALCLIEDDPKVGGGTSLRAGPTDATRKGLR